MLAQLPPALQNLQLPLRLRLWDGHEINLGPAPSVTIVVKDPQMVSQFTHPSLDALGAAFIEGKLELEGSISEVIRVCDELSSALLDEDEDSQPVRSVHDKETDAKSISYHYDLSNAFYQLWLDSDMAYSCAYFETGSETLEQAQQAKFRHLCRKLRLQPGDYLLDVGCGWGGLARYAAREFGAKVFGITLSKEQLELARERVKAEGLE
ncbi:SAM-dependent methyltransferase, partial [Pseudomonas sp. HMWF007]